MDQWVNNTLRPRRNRRHFADYIFKCIFMNENAWISNEISLKFVLKDPINNMPSYVQTMAWRRPGDKPLSEPMMVRSFTHICVTRPQWVNPIRPSDAIWHMVLFGSARYLGYRWYRKYVWVKAFAEFSLRPLILQPFDMWNTFPGANELMWQHISFHV